jgi:hypothetical protein
VAPEQLLLAAANSQDYLFICESDAGGSSQHNDPASGDFHALAGAKSFHIHDPRRAVARRRSRPKPYGDFILSDAAKLSDGAYLRPMKIEQKRKVRLIPHEAVLDTGSFEVAYPDGRPSDFFYFEDNPGRRLRPDVMTRPEAQRAAQAKARQEQDAFDGN